MELTLELFLSENSAVVEPGRMATAKIQRTPSCRLTVTAIGTEVFAERTVTASITGGQFNTGASFVIWLFRVVTPSSISGSSRRAASRKLGLNRSEERRVGKEWRYR